MTCDEHFASMESTDKFLRTEIRNLHHGLRVLLASGLNPEEDAVDTVERYETCLATLGRLEQLRKDLAGARRAARSALADATPVEKLPQEAAP